MTKYPSSSANRSGHPFHLVLHVKPPNHPEHPVDWHSDNRRMPSRHTIWSRVGQRGGWVVNINDLNRIEQQIHISCEWGGPTAKNTEVSKLYLVYRIYLEFWAFEIWLILMWIEELCSLLDYWLHSFDVGSVMWLYIQCVISCLCVKVKRRLCYSCVE